MALLDGCAYHIAVVFSTSFVFPYVVVPVRSIFQEHSAYVKIVKNKRDGAEPASVSLISFRLFISNEMENFPFCNQHKPHDPVPVPRGTLTYSTLGATAPAHSTTVMPYSSKT
jgi:hypothetical protein